MCESIMKTKTLRESLTSSSSFSSVTSEAATTTSSKKRARRAVSFSTVETREYPMILDESRVRIPYLTSDWESFNTSTSAIPDYDEISEYERARTKPLPAKERVLILLRAGYTADELREHLTKPEIDEKKRKNLFSKMKIFKFVQQTVKVNRAA